MLSWKIWVFDGTNMEHGPKQNSPNNLYGTTLIKISLQFNMWLKSFSDETEEHDISKWNSFWEL